MHGTSCRQENEWTFFKTQNTKRRKYGTSLGFKPNNRLTLLGQMIDKHRVQGGVGKALMDRIKSSVRSLNLNCQLCEGVPP